MAERRRTPTPPRSTPPPPTDPDVERRLADLERDLREKARAARERAQRAARQAAAAASPKRASDEELGYIRTDDSLGKILSDARREIADRLGNVREEPVRERVADLLDEVAAVLRGGRSGADDPTGKPPGEGSG
jgi:vacuolar-type H+-ATPase subunit E/Vma4